MLPPHLSFSALLCISVTAPLSFSVSFSLSLPQISVQSSLFVLGLFVLDLYVVMFCSFVGLSFDVCVCGCSHLWTQITLFTTTFLHENMPSSFLALLELHSSPLCLSLWELWWWSHDMQNPRPRPADKQSSLSPQERDRWSQISLLLCIHTIV